MRKQLCIVLVAVSLYGCVANNPEKEVAANVTELTNTYLHPNKEALDKLLSDDVTYGHSIGLVQDKAGITDNLLHGPFHFINITITGQTIKILKDIAIVRHTLSGDDTNAGVAEKFKFGILLIWQQTDGQWKLIARQAIKL